MQQQRFYRTPQQQQQSKPSCSYPAPNKSGQNEEYFKIEGTCMEMCPREEILLREREGLLHKFEIQEVPQEPSPSWPVLESSNYASSRSGPGGHNRARGRGGRNQFGHGRKPLPKADYHKTIKSFARSAAGQDKTLPEDLRPARVLKNTVKYLCTEILIRKDCPFSVIYDFIFDRLRSVRQDLVIQRIENEDAIIILEAIVKFHIYSDFRLRNEPVSVYDPHINQKHLVDCLRKLLCLYDVNDYWKPSRCEFESLNCLIFMESYDVITRAYSIKSKLNMKQFDTALIMALAYQSRNYVRFFRKLMELSPVLQMYCVRYIPVVRSSAFQVMSAAYGINNCKIPLDFIAKLLLYRDSPSLHQDLSHIAVEIIRDDNDGKYVKFQKSNAAVIQSKAGVTGNISSYFYSAPLQVIMKDFSSVNITQLVCRI